MPIRSLPLTVAVLSLAFAVLASEEARLLRFPVIYGGTIVFTHAGDLYAVPAAGGAARRLTSHSGYECFPRFSPDGQWLAFTGQYDGNTEVYLMPAEGGDPRRLTITATLARDDVSDRMGPNNIVMGWTPDSKRVVFRSRMREANDFIGRLYTVGLDGGLPEQLPFSRGGFCTYSPDGSKLAYNRIFREFRTWKRYRGGMADDIWVHDFRTGQVENITNDPASDVFPMWKGGRIYFLSDRDQARRMNLYAYDTVSRQTRRLTDFADFDVKFPSLGDDAIVFENGGWLYRFDLASEKAVRVPVTLPNDRPWARGGVVAVQDDLTTYEIAPDGKRALVGARGEVFTVPAKYGPTRNLTQTSAVHERNAQWSPDGKWIAFVSDAAGEDEIFIVPQDGSAPPTRLTNEQGPYLYRLLWSPDSEKILWADKDLNLKILEVKSKAVKTIARATAGEFSDYAWSPDSRWVAYTRPEEKAMQRVYLYGLEGGKTLAVTDGWTASYGAAFASDGKVLFFVSDRDFHPIYGDTEWNHVYKDMARIYLVTLGRTVDSPLKPKSDEVEIKEIAGKPESQNAGKAKEKGKDERKEEEASEAVTVVVDAEGLPDRIVALPVKAASYRNLASAGEKLYYIRSTHAEEKSELVSFDLNERKETVLGEADGYALSRDGKKMLIGRDGDLYLVDAPAAPVELKEPLDLSGLTMRLDRPMEWRHIFEESWRQMREFFYAPNMHGMDWAGVRAQYEPLAAAAAHRADLTYVIGEMIGELNAGHAYTGGGDLPKVPRVRTGLLGAELSKDPATGYFKIVRILPGQNWDPARRSPLTEVGVDVQEGEYILAVDGRPAAPMANLFDALIDTVDRQVKLTVNSKPVPEGARDVVVPIGDEQPLYYHAWVQGNIKKVDRATGGKVGYLHIPDMSEQGLNEFVKLYYPQIRKQGLIVDVRGNGGGKRSCQEVCKSDHATWVRADLGMGMPS
jgi:tricorn protease